MLKKVATILLLLCSTSASLAAPFVPAVNSDMGCTASGQVIGYWGAGIACGWDGTTPASWTPTDNSGASLTFTGVHAEWTQIGNMIFASVTLTYPTTISGSAASIAGLPVVVPNQAYAATPSTIYGGSGSVFLMLPTINTSTATILSGTGTAATNVTLSGKTITVLITYPAS